MFDKINNIDKYSKLWVPQLHKGRRKNTSSWFDLTEYRNKSPTSRFKYKYKNEGVVTRAKEIILYPNENQILKLQQWCKIYTRIYNMTVNYLHYRKLKSFQSLRRIIKAKIKNNKPLATYIKVSKIPSHTIDNAIHDVIKAYKSALSNKRNGNIKRFRLRYKRNNNMLTLEGSAFSKKNNTFCSLGELQSTDSIKGITRDCRLIIGDKTKLYCPYDKNIVQTKKKRVCSLDPGIRTFLTGYSEKRCFEINTSKINKLHKCIDNAENKKHKKRLRDKLRHMIDDLHWKSIKYLTTHYGTILIGDMSTRSIVSKDKFLPKCSKRMIYNFALYRFKQRLISKCEELGIRYLEVDESYTSKTCGGCGTINDKLGSNKYFMCKCGYNTYRDINGARNILIKNIHLL